MIRKILLVNLFFTSFIALDYWFYPDLFCSFISIIGFMGLIWLISLMVKDASIVDIFWGPCLVVFGLSINYYIGETSDRSLLILGLVSLWALRIALHIGIRNIGHGEDVRYIGWRKEAGQHWWWVSFFRGFYLQGCFAYFVGMPLYFGQINPATLTTIEIVICTSLFALGLLWETISDFQLKSFRKNPDNKGKICDIGLWRYSRRPNYFGDLMCWIGLFAFTVSSMDTLNIIFSACGPIVMGLIFYKITGPMMDAMMIKSRPEYKEYIKNSNMLLPNLMKGK